MMGGFFLIGVYVAGALGVLSLILMYAFSNHVDESSVVGRPSRVGIHRLLHLHHFLENLGHGHEVPRDWRRDQYLSFGTALDSSDIRSHRLQHASLHGDSHDD